MTSYSIVRAAVPEDREEIWRLFRSLHSENAMFSISERKVNYHLDRFINPSSIAPDDQGVRGFIGCIGPVGALEGVIMISIGYQWYSDDYSLDELLNFVDPAHRESNHAIELIEYAKRIVDQISPDYPNLRLIIGILSLERTAAKIRLYARKLKFCGAFFTYPPFLAASDEPLHMMKIRLHKGH